MKDRIQQLAIAIFLLSAVGVGAQDSTQALSGPRLSTGLKRNVDPVQAHNYCAKSSQDAWHVGESFSALVRAYCGQPN